MPIFQSCFAELSYAPRPFGSAAPLLRLREADDAIRRRLPPFAEHHVVREVKHDRVDAEEGRRLLVASGRGLHRRGEVGGAHGLEHEVFVAPRRVDAIRARRHKHVLQPLRIAKPTIAPAENADNLDAVGKLSSPRVFLARARRNVFAHAFGNASISVRLRNDFCRGCCRMEKDPFAPTLL